MNSENEKLREAFEEWFTATYTAHKLSPRQTNCGIITDGYADSRVDLCWRGWVASRAALSQQAEQPPVATFKVPAIPQQWSKSLSHCWPKYLDDKDGDWCVGTVDEDGRLYEVLTVEAAQYDAAGESQKIAEAIVELWAFAADAIAQTSPPTP